MEREKYFEATEFQNIKDLIYDAVNKYKEKIAFIIKHKNCFFDRLYFSNMYGRILLK